MLKLVSLTIAVSACGFAPRQNAIDPSDGALPGDGHTFDDAMLDGPPACMASGQTDDFSSLSICSPWATHDMTNAAVVQGTGKLMISPLPNLAGTHGGCFAINASQLGPEGLFAEILSVTSGVHAYTALTAYSTTGAISAVIVVEGGMLIVRNTSSSEVGGMMPYDASTMRWWRLRPVATGIVGEYSKDAHTWTLLGSLAGTMPTGVRIDLSVGTSQAEPNPGTGTFSHLDICP